MDGCGCTSVTTRWWLGCLDVQLLSAELAQLYRDSTESLPPLTLSFRDYVLAQRELEAQRTLPP